MRLETRICTILDHLTDFNKKFECWLDLQQKEISKLRLGALFCSYHTLTSFVIY